MLEVEAKEKDTVTLYPLKKHSYPFFIKMFWGTVLLMFIITLPYFLVIELPPLRILGGTIVQANNSFMEKNYDDAVNLYAKVLQLQPNNKKAKIALAKSYFAISESDCDDYYYDIGMQHLKGITMDKKEFAAIADFVPADYLDSFNSSFIWEKA